MLRSGDTIGGYTLIDKLGSGGFGAVWLAEKRSHFVTKKVAVKLPHDEQVNFDAIRQEATLWEQASGHPNVLPIIDADVYDGQVLIVSEYADGGSLADQLKDVGTTSVKYAVELTIGILNGLEFLHGRGIIHRDIKPQNILLQGTTPPLADFGISRAMQTTAISSTIIGTDAYMAPEAFDGKRSIQTDIWSVGVVLYQLLKGSLPFPQEHPSERMFAVLTKEFEPLDDDVPASLREIVAKALQKLPENRYGTTGEMRDDLQRALVRIAHPGLVKTEVLKIDTAGLPPKISSASEEVATVAAIDGATAVMNRTATGSIDEKETVVRTGGDAGEIAAPSDGPLAADRQVWLGTNMFLVLIALGSLAAHVAGTFDYLTYRVVEKIYFALPTWAGHYFDRIVTLAGPRLITCSLIWTFAVLGVAAARRRSRSAVLGSLGLFTSTILLSALVARFIILGVGYSWAAWVASGVAQTALLALLFAGTFIILKLEGSRENSGNLHSLADLIPTRKNVSENPFIFRIAGCFLGLVVLGVVITVASGRNGLAGDPAYVSKRYLLSFNGEGGKKGYRDISNVVVVPAKYDETSGFSEDDGVGEVKLNGKWGLVDINGNEVVPPKYDNQPYFFKDAEGLSSAVSLDGKYGFIDKTGRTVIPFEFEGGQWFVGGLAPVKKDGKYGYIDKTGKAVIPFRFDTADVFGKNGVAIVGQKKTDLSWSQTHAIIDKTGKELTPYKYELIFDSGDGDLLMVITSDEHVKFTYGYIDTHGNEVIHPQFDGGEAFHGGKAKVKLDGREFYIDKNGAETSPPTTGNSNN